ncbi:MAG: hypothetical protein KKB94_10365 [Proteobacteria bacterium]|nr:hypothetical protein [Pseudomonadota bacterium]
MHILKFGIVTTLVLLLAACGSGQVKHPPLESLSTVQNVAKNYGPPSCFFSYVADAAKYDLISFKDSPSVVVFENGALYTIMPSVSKPLSEFDQILKMSMEKEELPMENGLGVIHAWIKENRVKSDKPLKLDDFSMNALDNAGAAAVMAVGLPVWFPFAAVGGLDHVLSRKEQDKALQVNQSLMETGRSYETFLSLLSDPDLTLSKPSYSVKMFILDKSFFSQGQFIYIVGSREGKVQWVSYNDGQIKTKTFQYNKKIPAL